jgi:hypothetical protein
MFNITVLSLGLFLLGVIASIFIRGVPMRGWIALSLLILSGLFWALSEPSDSLARERLWTLPCFMFFAPVAVIYSFRARKSAPDQLLARSAFVGAILIGVALIFMLCGMAYLFYLTITPRRS